MITIRFSFEGPMHRKGLGPERTVAKAGARVQTRTAVALAVRGVPAAFPLRAGLGRSIYARSATEDRYPFQICFVTPTELSCKPPGNFLQC